jgi:hypothetical protein
VQAALHGKDATPLKYPRDKPPFMARRGGGLKKRHVPVGDTHRVFYFIGQKAQARTQDQHNFRGKTVKPAAQVAGRFLVLRQCEHLMYLFYNES